MRHALVLNGEILEYRNYAPNVDQFALAPTKPKMLPVVVENEAYDPVSQVRTGPEIIIEPTQVIERYTVRAKTTQEIDNMRVELVRQLQLEFALRIDKIMPSGAQFTMLITGLVGILETGLNRASWPAPIRNVFNPLYTIAKDQGTALYQVYQTKLAAVNALTTAAEIDAYDVTVGWP